jgi:allophanate hydrolase subunit 2
MDTIAHAIANALVGNKRDAIVLEMHIPAAEIVFNKETLFTFTGAATSATLGNETVYSNQPIIVNAESKLSFNARANGARIYIAVQGGFILKRGKLQKNDVLLTVQSFDYHFEGVGQLHALTTGWTANTGEFYRSNIIRCIQGPNFNVLSKKEIEQLKQQDIQSIKNYLREKGLIKLGSQAPNSILRKMYEDSILSGEINNNNNTNLVFNYLNT